MVHLQAVEPLFPVGSEHVWLGDLGQCLVGRRMAVPDSGGFPRRLEALGRELAHHLQHQQPGLVEVGHTPQKALIRKLVKTRKHVHAKLGSRPAHLFGLFQVGAARKNGESCKQPLLRLVQQVVAPRDRPLQRLLPAGQVA